MTIRLGDNASLHATNNVYLEDKQKNTLKLLNSSDYAFTSANDLIGTRRFFLRYFDDILSLIPNGTINELIINTNKNNKDIIIKIILTAATKIDLYEIQGVLVLIKKLEQSSLTNRIDVSSIRFGI